MRQEKQLLLDQIKENIAHSEGMILTSFEKLGPELSWSLQERLSTKKVKFEVVKKRIFEKAADECGLKYSLKEIEGHLAILYINDTETLTATKMLCQFVGDNEENFKVLNGRFEKKDYSAKEVIELSRLPSLDEMRSQFIATLEAPMSQTVAVMESLLTSVLFCLENKSKQTS